MSNASDRPEPAERPSGEDRRAEPATDQGAGTPAGEQPTTPGREPDEAGPERGTSDAGPDPAPPGRSGEAVTEPVVGAADPGVAASTEDLPSVPDAEAASAADERKSESVPETTGGDHGVDVTKPGPSAQPDHPQPGYGPPSAEPTDYGPQGHQQPGYGQPAYGPPGYGPPGYGSPGYGTPGHGQLPGYGPAGYGPFGYGQPPGIEPPPYGGRLPGQAPRPGIVPLRPLAVGDVLAGAVGYIRANPLATIGVSAAVVVVIQALRLLVVFALPRVDPAALAAGRIGGLFGSLLGVLLSAVVAVALGAVLTGLLLVVLSRAVLGQRIGVRHAWQAVSSRVPGLIGLTLRIAFVIVGIMMIALLLGLVIAATGSGRSIGLAAVLFLVAAAGAAYLAVLWALAPAAYVLEPVGGTAAMRRSARLVRGSWWRTFGILLLSAFLVAGPAVAVLGLFGTLSFQPSGAGGMIRAALAYAIVGTFAAPFGVGVTGLVYVDQRIRRERLDLDLMR